MIKRLRLVSAIAWTLVILILCWTPDIYLPVEEEPGFLSLLLPFPIDKAIHVAIFTVFAVLWLRAMGGGWKCFAWVALAGIALAALSEIGQEVPIVNRDGSWEDGLADCLGVLLGFPAFLLLERYLKRLAVRPVPDDRPPADAPADNVRQERRST